MVFSTRGFWSPFVPITYANPDIIKLLGNEDLQSEDLSLKASESFTRKNLCRRTVGKTRLVQEFIMDNQPSPSLQTALPNRNKSTTSSRWVVWVKSKKLLEFCISIFVRGC